MFPAFWPTRDQLSRILDRDVTPPSPRKKQRPGPPPAERPGETIGGGFIVIRLGRRTGRLRPAPWAFEHATLSSAMAEAAKLRAAYPGERFQVWRLAADDCDIA